ncbi:hypothetical protein KFL_003420030 [Klebsormidium nitens]|uniref:Uncharacterized protein n=1 Tax=Klebsormidium nitens TaxID=105231 RepID=A0A1Y1I8G3_KLENI|nr:hypothetical protein KFL_003420030 [Klebsormidium nitens]|eukprot:GAQ87264.1 hypothetical protein KFL_003420030 [Klebsormidium nitens]
MHATARLPSRCSFQNCQNVSFSHGRPNVVSFLWLSSLSPNGLKLKAPLCKGESATRGSPQQVAIIASKHCSYSKQKGFPSNFSHQTQGNGLATTGRYLQSHWQQRQSREGHTTVPGATNDKVEGDVTSLTGEDVQYLLKLFASCTVGAIVVKYGSILLPGLTTPNLVQAVFMIFAPCLVVAMLLQIQSNKGSK